MQRFWSKVNKNGPIPSFNTKLGKCWIWQAAIFKSGYGAFGYLGKVVRAHRMAYLLKKGEIPAGLDLDHLCHVRRCVNPSHLEAVSRSVNLNRGFGPDIASRRWRLVKSCNRGHKYTPSNTRIYRNRYRICRQCARDSIRQRRSKAKAEAEAECPGIAVWPD